MVGGDWVRMNKSEHAALLTGSFLGTAIVVCTLLLGRNLDGKLPTLSLDPRPTSNMISISKSL